MANQINHDQPIAKLISKKRRFFLIFLLMSIFTGIAGGNWLLTSPSGLQWLLATVSRISAGSVSFEGVSGTFHNPRAHAIHFISDDLQLTIGNFELDWQPRALLSGHLVVNTLSAQDIEVLSPPSPTPLTLPENLNLPVALSINQLNVATLRLFSKKGEKPDFSATDLKATLESDGQQHLLSNLSLNTAFGLLNGTAQINGEKPFNLSAEAKLIGLTKITGHDLPETSISAIITGNLSQLELTMAASGEILSGDGEILLQPFAVFPVAAVRLSIAGLNPGNFSARAPNANLLLQVDLRENIKTQLSGNLSIKNRAAAPLDQGGLPLQEINAVLKLTTDSLQFDDLLLQFAENGIISGNFSWNYQQSTGTADLKVNQLNPLVLDTRLRPARINGHIKLNGNTEMQRGIMALKDDALSLDAELTHTAAAITLEKLLLRRNQSLLTGQGRLDLDEQQSFSFEGSLKRFNLADFIHAPHSDLNTTLKLAGNLAPHATASASFKLENSRLAAQPVSGKGLIKFDKINQATAAIELSIGSNHLRAQGGFGKPEDRLHLEIVAPALAQIGMGIDGSFTMKADFSGSLASPVLHFDLAGDNLSLPGDHYLDQMKAQGSLQGEAITLNIDVDHYRSHKKIRLQHLNIAVTGYQFDHQLRAKARINDEIEVQLQFAGGLLKTTQISPTLQWAGELSQLSATGALPFHLLTATKLELGTERVSLGSTQLAIAGGHISIGNSQWTPQGWYSQGNFTGLSLRPGSAAERKLESLQLGGEWHITSAAQLNGNLHIAREKGDWILPGESPLPLGLQTLQLSVEANNGVLTGELAVKGERIGEANGHINIPLTKSATSWAISPNANLNGTAAVNITDISWIGPYLDERLASGGQWGLQAELTGSWDKPELLGKIQGENLSLALLDHGIRLQQGKLKAHFDHSSLQIDNLDFIAPNEPPPNDPLLAKLDLDQTPGQLAISGVIGFTGEDSNLQIELNRLPLVHLSNHWIIASGKGHARFSENTLTLGGNITADAGFLTQPPSDRPQLADDVIITGQSPQDTQKIKLDLDVILDLGKQFYLRASGLEGRLAGSLHIKSDPQQNLKVTGSIATNNANFEAYGQRLTVKRGIVNFNGPLDDPGLNVLATRKGVPVEAGVEVLGTVRHPRIRLVSTPNVPDADKLSWIVFGRALSSGGVDTSLLLSAAGSILGGQSGGGITQQLSQALGVDEISFRQTASTANTGNPLTEQIGIVGKRLSSRAYISYERGITSANAGITKLTYSLTPRINIVTQTGVDNAIDVFYTVQFD
ncbi:MAG: translocation/assembly module TamB domain-containing protein [Nitrosomonas sp.]|nr:translocation/assembly module TamB domain-containing protein [Nitrosomonas sp.]MDP1950621.1 translocation/assembly module TamB domain-containing protein [Nitrosomonas sp.]